VSSSGVGCRRWHSSRNWYRRDVDVPFGSICENCRWWMPVHEQKNGSLGSIYNDVTNFTQIQDLEGPTNWNSAYPRGLTWMLLLNLTSSSPWIPGPHITCFSVNPRGSPKPTSDSSIAPISLRRTGRTTTHSHNMRLAGSCPSGPI
jgi:hypothetical protein